MRSLIYLKNNSERLDRYLSSIFEYISRSQFKHIINDGHVTINGKIAKNSSTLNYDDKIIISSFEVSSSNEIAITPEKIDLNIIYEDEDLLVINKEAGIVVHPGAGNFTGTLANGIQYYLDDTSKVGKRAGIVHRLDKETTGIIVVAKNNFSLMKLSEQFYNREVNKEYIAFSLGKIPEEGKIEGYLSRNSRNRKIYSLTNNSNQGRFSLTTYKRLMYRPPVSIVKLFPQTGRTHQLRVHLKSIGRPIIADKSYSGGRDKIKSFHSDYSQFLKRVYKIINRVALHAYKLEIRHPVSMEKMIFKADVPNDMKLVENLIKNMDISYEDSQ